ncbi:MAG: hypothetical protein U0871_04775 [Gemmataceae bacterium]
MTEFAPVFLWFAIGLATGVILTPAGEGLADRITRRRKKSEIEAETDAERVNREYAHAKLLETKLH